LTFSRTPALLTFKYLPSASYLSSSPCPLHHNYSYPVSQFPSSNHLAPTHIPLTPIFCPPL
jgi:hypothetical protein